MASVGREIPDIIVLAAGSSSRLGQPKQLVDFKQNSLLYRQCLLASEHSPFVHCVLGYQAERMKLEINPLKVSTIVNSNWQQGLASSIAAGVSQLGKESSAVMLLLVDQWQLSSKDLTELIQRWRANPENIIAATKDESSHEPIGPPVIYPRKYFQELCQLSQGNGAKSVLKRHQEQVIALPLAHAFVDLDTPEQLKLMQRFVNDH